MSKVEALELVRAALVGLRFGEIALAVHDGEVVQIARTEKTRIAQTAGSAKPRR